MVLLPLVVALFNLHELSSQPLAVVRFHLPVHLALTLWIMIPLPIDLGGQKGLKTTSTLFPVISLPIVVAVLPLLVGTPLS